MGFLCYKCKKWNKCWEKDMGGNKTHPICPPCVLKYIPYKDYLKSEHWKSLRLVKLEEANNRCQLCNSVNHLNVHHRTYERRGREHLSDLTVLCQPCHGKHHNIMAKEPEDNS